MLCWAGGTGAVESTRDPAATFRGKVPHGAEAYAGAAFNATGHAALTFVDDYHGEEQNTNVPQNLMMFKQIAGGIDDRTWEHHLRAGDYSRWFHDVVKDKELAREARAVEADRGLDAKESRRRIGEAVTRRYTAPARAE